MLNKKWSAMTLIKQNLFKFIICLCLVACIKVESIYQSGNDGKVHFVGYKVFRMVPTNEAQLGILRDLSQKEDYSLDFWKAPSIVNEVVDVMVPPEKFLYVERLLRANNITRLLMMQDVERYIQNEKLEYAPSNVSSDKNSNAFFSTYRSLKEIHAHIEGLAAANQKIATILSAGKSSENRDLKIIKIGNISPNSAKPSIWLDAGIHAREWISIPTVTYIATKLVEDYDKDRNVKELVDTYDWYILPVVNPDGYEYSRTTNRMWRKTRYRSAYNPWGCTGTDLNRNFDFHWNEGGSSLNPCSEAYAGPKAFSEPESKAISEFILERKANMKAFVAIHAYSQLWLTPWGWTKALPKDYSSMVDVAQKATNALSQLYGTKYRIGSSTNILYIATGGADDWAHGVAGVKYTYTLELRDTGRYGFLLPAQQIIPTGEETLEAIKEMAKAIKKEL